MNQGSLDNPNVHIIIADAFEYLLEVQDKEYDLIIADFPDPHLQVLSKLFSLEFYKNIARILCPTGIFVTLACDIEHTRRCFDCIGDTLSKCFQFVR